MKVTQNHFGGNILYNDGNIAVTNLTNTQYNTMWTQLGLGNIRYPGGTVTEALGITMDEDVIFSQNPKFISLQDAVDFAKRRKCKINFVFPTRFGNDIKRIQEFAAKLVKYDMSVFDSIEIGNEYWAHMTEAEYVKICNNILPILGKLTDVDLFIQCGQTWKTVSNTEAIRDGITKANRQYVGGVVSHWYVNDFRSNTATGRVLKDLFIFKDGYSKNLRTYVSEWNSRGNTDKQSDLQYSGDLISMFHRIIKEGVQNASIWGVCYRALKTRLSTINPQNIIWITPHGMVYRHMTKNLIGLEAVDNSVKFAGTDVHVFKNDKKIVVYVVNETGKPLSFVLKMPDFVTQSTNAKIWNLTTYDLPGTKDHDESDPQNDFVRATEKTVHYNGTVALAPYGICAITADIIKDVPKVSNDTATNESSTSTTTRKKKKCFLARLFGK